MNESQTINLRFDRIHQLLSWNRLKEAADEALQLLREEPEDPDAYALMGRIALRMEQYDQALHWSGEALQRDPENYLGWFVRVNTYYETENMKDASASLYEALRIFPYESHYYFLLANIANRKGRFTEAKEHLEQALELMPENALYLANLSYVEALLNQNAVSRQLAAEALRLAVEEHLVYLYLAWAADRRNDHELGLEMMKNAIRLDPDNKQIRDEYLEGLQKSYLFYRIVLWPGNKLKQMKPWQVFVTWLVLAIVFRPFIILFLIVYVITHWTTKLLVHVKVFGWQRRPKR